MSDSLNTVYEFYKNEQDDSISPQGNINGAPSEHLDKDETNLAKLHNDFIERCSTISSQFFSLAELHHSAKNIANNNEHIEKMPPWLQTWLVLNEITRGTVDLTFNKKKFLDSIDQILKPQNERHCQTSIILLTHYISNMDEKYFSKSSSSLFNRYAKNNTDLIEQNFIHDILAANGKGNNEKENFLDLIDAVFRQAPPKTKNNDQQKKLKHHGYLLGVIKETLEERYKDEDRITIKFKRDAAKPLLTYCQGENAQKSDINKNSFMQQEQQRLAKALTTKFSKKVLDSASERHYKISKEYLQAYADAEKLLIHYRKGTEHQNEELYHEVVARLMEQHEKLTRYFKNTNITAITVPKDKAKTLQVSELLNLKPIYLLSAYCKIVLLNPAQAPNPKTPNTYYLWQDDSDKTWQLKYRRSIDEDLEEITIRNLSQAIDDTERKQLINKYHNEKVFEQGWEGWAGIRIKNQNGKEKIQLNDWFSFTSGAINLFNLATYIEHTFTREVFPVANLLRISAAFLVETFNQIGNFLALYFPTALHGGIASFPFDSFISSLSKLAHVLGFASVIMYSPALLANILWFVTNIIIKPLIDDKYSFSKWDAEMKLEAISRLDQTINYAFWTVINAICYFSIFIPLVGPALAPTLRMLVNVLGMIVGEVGTPKILAEMKLGYIRDAQKELEIKITNIIKDIKNDDSITLSEIDKKYLNQGHIEEVLTNHKIDPDGISAENKFNLNEHGKKYQNLTNTSITTEVVSDEIMMAAWALTVGAGIMLLPNPVTQILGALIIISTTLWILGMVLSSKYEAYKKSQNDKEIELEALGNNKNTFFNNNIESIEDVQKEQQKDQVTQPILKMVG